MQKFNSINVEARFIKSLLKNTYLPVIPTVMGGDYLVEGTIYTYKDKIIKCNKPGLFGVDGLVHSNLTYVPRMVINNGRVVKSDTVSVACDSAAICKSAFKCGDGIGLAEFEVVQTYDSNTFSPGITSSFTSNSERYDIDTHRNLGKYLRWYRDTKDIDLMSMYNCFDGESTSFACIKDGKISGSSDNAHKSWIVPAMPNRNYTIFIDSTDGIEIKGVFLNEFGRISAKGLARKKFIDEDLTGDLLTKTFSTYSQPILYGVFTTDTNILSHMNNFFILIQTSKSHNGSIVVLEGDYTRRCNRIITSAEDVSCDYGDFKPTIFPSLSVMPSKYIVPYSNRLIEFLTQNVIANDEDIPKNVLRVQESVGYVGNNSAVKDVWDDKLRFLLFNKYYKYKNDYYFSSSCPSDAEIKNRPESILAKDNNGIVVGLKNCIVRRDFDTNCDITGYVDKDVEYRLCR